MYRYSNGVNLVAGGEKHRVYVKKSPTGVGKGVKGHVMVNHPTEDKGKWDTIDLTEKAGAKTVEQGKAATKKWHRENPYKMQKGNKSLKSTKPAYKDYLKTVNPDFLGPDYNLEEAYKNLPYETMRAWAKDPNRNHLPDTYKLPNHPTFSNESMYYKPGMKAGKWEGDKYIPIGDTLKKLSGAKSVKQYRGDENLPEAKNGMKKNCGCKHSRSKYKYQAGTKGAKSKALVMEDLYSEMGDLTGNTPEKLLRSGIIVDKNVNRAIIRANDEKKNKAVNVLTGQNRDVRYDKNPYYIDQLYKNPKGRVTPTGYYILDPDFVNEQDKKDYHGNVSHLKPISANNRKAPISRSVSLHETFDPKNRNPLYGTKKSNASFGCVNINPKDYKYAIENTGVNDTIAIFDSRRPADRDLLSRYQAVTNMKAKGANALTIPEGSAIVTANGGKNKQALAAYKKGNYKLLNKIIDEMPEDNVSKKQGGTNDLKSRYQYLAGLTGPLSEEQKKELENIKTELTKPSYDLYDDKRIAEKFGQKYDVDKAKYRSSLKGGKLKLIENAKNVAYRNRLRNEPAFFQEEMKAGRVTVDKSGNVAYKPQGKYSTNAMEFLGTSKTGELPEIPTSSSTPTPSTPPATPPGTPPPPPSPKKKEFGEIPSLAEIAARASILGKGIEYSHIPENYLALGRYRYESQLPKTLREIQLAEQTGREVARDIVAGDAGRYLAQAGSLSADRMKTANEAVIQDTLARQDILNKNVDLGNVESQTNRALKDQYAAMRNEDRMKARAAYDEQLVSLGQRIDSATETGRQMSNQRNVDDIRTNLLKSKDYYMDPQGNIRMGKNGLKKVKAYKRR